MLNGRITYIIIIQAVFIENKADSQWDSLASKLVNRTRFANLESDFKYRKIDIPEIESRCEYKGTNGCDDQAQRSGRNRFRFLDQGTNSSESGNEMEAPAGKFSFFNLLSSGEEEGGGGGEEEDDLDIESDDYEDGEKVKEGEEEEDDDDDYDGINLFGDDEEIALNKLKDKNDEGFLKQYHRHRVRMQSVIFPLLLAYKLKFFTVLPLLLGSLVLLVGTTGVAGFFFALFAAALGLHVKAEHD